MKVVNVIQCTSSDIGKSLNPSDYCISVSKECGLFDQVIIARPEEDTGEIDQIAADWGVPVFVGETYNVGARLLGSISQIDEPVIVVRTLLRQFYLDVNMLSLMIRTLISDQADYMQVPFDYNYAMVGDVCSLSALKRAVEEIEKLTDKRKKKSYRFSPWVYFEHYPEKFKLSKVSAPPMFPKKKVDEIREKLRTISSENQVHFNAEFPASSYRFIGQYLHETDRVLDIACGKGQGSKCLTEFARKVVGVDIDPANVEIARASDTSTSNLKYVIGDAQSYAEQGSYDAIVSLHTLEHLPDPQSFWRESWRNLRGGGRIFVEVPLLLPKPLGMPLVPWHTMEYSIDQLVDECRSADFQILELWAKERHIFTELSGVCYDPVRAEKRFTSALIIAQKG